jgi:threonyl-tRNA synthetase
VIYNELIDYVRETQGAGGYDEVITPQILDVDLWHTSGHYANYQEAMFFSEVDDREFAVKPMNCPTHCLIYKTQLRSYRDLPIRYSDFGRLHRYERSGVTSGLTRVRSFSQDDAHIFCTEDQIETEVLAAVHMILGIYRTFAFENLEIELSTRPEKSLGTAEMWSRAESALEQALGQADIEFAVNQGEGAFYGPKVDFQVQDALGRQWQLGTVQLDYQLPERFDLNYIGEDGNQHRPVMIHRAMLGSLERFIGILIEHTGGAFPLWLAPVQAVVLPISEKFLEYGVKVQTQLEEAALRAELDGRNEKLGYRIREAQLNKVPYMIVVGAREEEANEITVRIRSGGDQRSETVEAFIARQESLVKQRSSDL